MNQKIKFYQLFLVVLTLFPTLTYSEEQKTDKVTNLISHDSTLKSENAQESSKEIIKAIIKNGIFSWISKRYQVDQDLLELSRLAFMFISFSVGSSFGINKTFVVANLIAGGINGLIINTGVTLSALPFSYLISACTEKVGISRRLALLLPGFFKSSNSYSQRFLLELIKNKSPYSLKFFLFKFLRGLTYTGQVLTQSTVGGILNEYCTLR